MTDYPDTQEGARALLRDLRQNRRVDGFGPDAAKLTPDPYVKGCWKAVWPDGARTLVYTQPHPAAPDFEEVD